MSEDEFAQHVSRLPPGTLFFDRPTPLSWFAILAIAAVIAGAALALAT